jgi:hypothetical protein
MAPEEQSDALLLHDKPMSAWETAEALGIDMSLVESSLRLTPDQRLLQHDCALTTIEMLERARKERNG